MNIKVIHKWTKSLAEILVHLVLRLTPISSQCRGHSQATQVTLVQMAGNKVGPV